MTTTATVNPFALDPTTTPAAATAPATAPVTNPFASYTPAAAPPGNPLPDMTQHYQQAAGVTQAAASAAGYAPGEQDPFSGPAPQRPRGPRLRDLYGRLLLIIPHKLEEGIPNRLGKPGDMQDRMTADVIILDGGPIAYGGAPEKVPPRAHDKTASVPHKNSRMFLSQAGIISQCREALAKKLTTQRPGMVLGRLAVGEAKGDNSPPYLLTPPTEADKQIARQYLATVDPFA